MNKLVYLDHAATTPLHSKVLEAMLPYFSEKFGNPSTIYALGQESRRAIDEARRNVAAILGCSPEEIIFTGGATEAIDIGLKGVAFASQSQGKHIVTSQVEHKAVLETCHFLERFGFSVTYVPVDEYGCVSPEDVAAAITDKTILISIMLANNEVGTIQPVSEIAIAVREKSKQMGRRIIFHSDAAQGAMWLDLDVNRLGIDLLDLSAHKIYGPKGTGILYLRKGTPFLPQQKGGGQERNLRGGTENVPGIIGTATALKLATENQQANSSYCLKLRDYFIKGIKTGITGAQLTGHPSQRLPNHASFCFQHIEGEAILLHLDFANVAASSGSACSSGSSEPSHVLSAMGVPPEAAHGCIRFTLGPENIELELDYTLSVLAKVIDRLREISPFAASSKSEGRSK